jgi:hypothetical protein
VNLVAVGSLLLALAMTVAIEIPVAALFGLRRRELGVVAAVSFVTNPPLNLFFALLSTLGVGYTKIYTDLPQRHLEHVVAQPWIWALLCLLELIVVVVEWRLLVWALAGKAGSSRRLLIISIAMNAASATLGTFLLSLFS